jgi:hypothetical protein
MKKVYKLEYNNVTWKNKFSRKSKLTDDWSIRAGYGATKSITRITKKEHKHAQIRPYRSARPKRQKIEQRKHSNQLMSRKTTQMYVLTTKMASPTHRGASALQEHILGPFTGEVSHCQQ